MTTPSKHERRGRGRFTAVVLLSAAVCASRLGAQTVPARAACLTADAFEEARRLCATALARDSNDLAVRVRLIGSLLDSEHPEKALGLAREGIPRHPQTDTLVKLAMDMLLESGDSSEAWGLPYRHRSWVDAAGLEANRQAGYFVNAPLSREGFIFVSGPNAARSVVIADSVLIIDPHHVLSLGARAKACISLKRYDEGVSYATRWRSAAPTDPEPIHSLAYISRRRGDYHQAATFDSMRVALFRITAPGAPSRVVDLLSSLIAWALDLEDAQKRTRGLGVLESGLADIPKLDSVSRWAIQSQRIQMLLRDWQPSAAAQVLVEASRILPAGKREAYNREAVQRGVAPERRVDLWRELTRRRPREPLAHEYLARELLCQSRVEEARRSFERALELDSLAAEAWGRYAWTLFLQGEAKSALGAWERAVGLQTDYFDRAAPEERQAWERSTRVLGRQSPHPVPGRVSRPKRPQRPPAASPRAPQPQT